MAAATPSGLEESLRKWPVSQDVKAALLRQLWGDVGESAVGTTMEAYLDYYSSRCREFLSDGGRHVSVKTHADAVRVARLILQGTHKDDIRLQRDGSPQEPPEEQQQQQKLDHASADLCAGLLTMVDCGVLDFRVSGRKPLQWPREGSLREFLASEFLPQKELEAPAARIEKGFLAMDISRVGIQIKWTSNLADHLRLTDDDKAVFIFHHAEFLKFQKQIAAAGSSAGIFPDGLLDETLRTLALLFPQSDSRTRRWIDGVKDIDSTVTRCGTLRAQDRRFEKFSTWHDRLVILKQAFDDAKPRSISQWWWDRRNGVQWYTFWVAILVFVLTVFFGTVQSIEGALQVYLSFKALQE